MAVFNPAANRPLQGGKGSYSNGFALIIYTLISAVLIFFDQSQHYLEQARYVLQALSYPVQLAASSPAKGVAWMQDNMRSRDGLEKQNAQLKAEKRDLQMELQRYEALEAENMQLRGLKEKLPPIVHKWLVGEVMEVKLDSLRARIVVNVGRSYGVFKGQTVIDDAGVIGQTTHVGPWSSEIILITDQEHAIPVEVERTGVRTIAQGVGDQVSLSLPFLPANADIKPGDRLITSGLGGVFPAGYPVAKVTEVHNGVRAIPYARCCAAISKGSFTSDREVVLVWFREGHPASPVDTIDDSDVKSRKECLQGALDSTENVLKKIQPEQGVAAARDLKTTAADALMKGFDCLDPPFRTQPQDGPAANDAAAGVKPKEKEKEGAPPDAAAEAAASAPPAAGAGAPPAASASASTLAAGKPTGARPALKPAAPKNAQKPGRQP
jgi:rod shape-determining protein MreC